jgi:hypothetical protein
MSFYSFIGHGQGVKIVTNYNKNHYFLFFLNVIITCIFLFQHEVDVLNDKIDDNCNLHKFLDNL